MEPVTSGTILASGGRSSAARRPRRRVWGLLLTVLGILTAAGILTLGNAQQTPAAQRDDGTRQEEAVPIGIMADPENPEPPPPLRDLAPVKMKGNQHLRVWVVLNRPANAGNKEREVWINYTDPTSPGVKLTDVIPHPKNWLYFNEGEQAKSFNLGIQTVAADQTITISVTGKPDEKGKVRVPRTQITVIPGVTPP